MEPYRVVGTILKSGDTMLSKKGTALPFVPPTLMGETTKHTIDVHLYTNYMCT